MNLLIMKMISCFTAGSGDYADLVKERERRKDIFTILEPLSDYTVEYLTWIKHPHKCGDRLNELMAGVFAKIYGEKLLDA